MGSRIIAVCLFVVSLAGCAARVKQVTDLPPGVTQVQAQNWDKAIANVHNIANVNSAIRQGLIATNKAGGFPDGPQYILSLQIVGKVDELVLSTDAVLKQSPNNFTDSTKAQVGDLMRQIATQISQLNQQGITGIKNPTSLQQINGLISQASGFVALILSL